MNQPTGERERLIESSIRAAYRHGYSRGHLDADRGRFEPIDASNQYMRELPSPTADLLREAAAALAPEGAGPEPPKIWGIPVVTDPDMPVDTLEIRLGSLDRYRSVNVPIPDPPEQESET